MVASVDVVNAVEIYAVVHFVVVGLSHVITPQSWVSLFVLMRDNGRPGAFAHGFLSLFFGSMIVAFHNVWSGLGAALTVVGWLYVAKSVTCIVFPQIQLNSLARVSMERAWELRVAGFAYLILAACLCVRLAGLDPFMR